MRAQDTDGRTLGFGGSEANISSGQFGVLDSSAATTSDSNESVKTAENEPLVHDDPRHMYTMTRLTRSTCWRGTWLLRCLTKRIMLLACILSALVVGGVVVYYSYREQGWNTPDAQVVWWNNHPDAPLGLSCLQSQPRPIPFPMEANGVPKGVFPRRDPYGVPKGVFTPRIPNVPACHRHSTDCDDERVQVAMVVPFAYFQLRKVRATIERWKNVVPCSPASDLDYAREVDIIFVSMGGSDITVKTETERYFGGMGELRSCFRHAKIRFMSVETAFEYGHFNGAAYMFFKLFELLEADYKTFFIAEPDVTPVQSGWVRGLVEASRKMGCVNGVWQMGSPPLNGVYSGSLHLRADFHMNGNGMYLLGCPAYEDYKCRVQTFYRPLGPKCALVAGCNTGKEFEDG